VPVREFAGVTCREDASAMRKLVEGVPERCKEAERDLSRHGCAATTNSGISNEKRLLPFCERAPSGWD